MLYASSLPDVRKMNSPPPTNDLNIKMLESDFDIVAFKGSLPLNHTVQWQKSVTGAFEGLDEVIEIPVAYPARESSKNRSPLTYKLLAVPIGKTQGLKENYDFYLVKFLHFRSTESEISIFDLNSFSGILIVIEPSQAVKFSYLYSQGVFIGETQEISEKEYKRKSFNKKLQESCYSVPVEHWTDWYKLMNGKFIYTHSVLNYTSFQEYCSSHVGGGTDGGFQGGQPFRRGGNSGGNNTEGEKLLVFDEKYVEDDGIVNELTGKAACVYEKMVDDNNNINWILKNFEDGKKPSEFKLVLQMSTSLGNDANGSLATPNQSGIFDTFIIRINQNRAENINTTLTIARTLIHEAIHARLWEFAYRNGKTVNSTDFPGVYEYMRKYGKNWDHQQMAAHYRKTIAEGLKQFDKGQHSDAFYDALAWEGLQEIKDLNGVDSKIYTEAWKNEKNKTQILDIIKNHKKNGSKICNSK